MSARAAYRDVRYNAPDRLSDLHGEDRRQVLLGRDQDARRRYMETYQGEDAAPAGEPAWVRYARLTATGLGTILFFYALGVAVLS